MNEKFYTQMEVKLYDINDGVNIFKTTILIILHEVLILKPIYE